MQHREPATGDRRTWLLLGSFVIIQGIWQLDHRGSSRSLAGAETAQYIEQHFAETDLLIQHPEVFVRLRENPHWLYYPLPGTGELIPSSLLVLTPEQRCMVRVPKTTVEENVHYGSSLVHIEGKYSLIPPPADCPKPRH